MWTWMAFMITALVLFILLYGKLNNFGPFILMLIGLPTFLSGIIIKFRPLVIGGIVFWVLSIAANYSGDNLSPLIMAAAVIAGYLIPGYLLKKRAGHEKL